MSVRRYGTIALGLLKKNKKEEYEIAIFTSRGAHVNCAIMAMLYTHSIEKSAVEHDGGV